MVINNANSMFIEDDEGIMVITDIKENKDMSVGEFVYDGKNVGIFNRDNEKYYALQNIPPTIRENILKSDEITVIEKGENGEVSAYSVKVRVVEDMGIPDKWDAYAKNLISELKEALTKEDFNKLIADKEID